MGNKYLETKNDTLESSILDVWKDAAKLDEYKTRLGEKKRVAGGDNRRTENKQPKEEGLESSPNAANSQHLCAKNVVHEDWGEGQPVHGMHAIPNSNGDIAWYDVMFEHGVEKGVSINELKVTKSESHHNHGGNGGKKKKKQPQVFGPVGIRGPLCVGECDGPIDTNPLFRQPTTGGGMWNFF